MLQWRDQFKQGEKKVIQVKHTHIHKTRPFSKTHPLILAMEGTNKKKNRLNIHRQHNTRPFSKTHRLMLQWREQFKQGEKGYIRSNIHTHTQDYSASSVI